jgi:DNA repair protein RadA/Sms
LRSFKNRFGASHELAIFDMRDDGMHEVDNISNIFVTNRRGMVSGSTLAVPLEGTRPIAVEIQALSDRTAFGLPRRATTGLDINRLHMLSAVLSKRCGLDLSSQDIYVNVVGGLRLDEPAVDLAVALAIFSSRRDLEIPPIAAIGEIGLGGEIRPVSLIRRRLAELQRLDIKGVLIPASGNLETDDITGLNLHRADTVSEALSIASRLAGA